MGFKVIPWQLLKYDCLACQNIAKQIIFSVQLFVSVVFPIVPFERVVSMWLKSKLRNGTETL